MQEPSPDKDLAYAQKAQREDLDSELRSLAGLDAIFCGHVGFGESFRAANHCARRAFKEKRAFYVGYDTGHGYRTYTSSGLARDANGRMYAVDFDSAGDLSRGYGELRDNSHIVTVPCPTPYHLLEGRNGGGIPRGWHRAPAKQLSCRLFGK